MTVFSPPEIVLPESASSILDLVNRVYLSAEAHFWNSNWSRTNINLIQTSIEQGELFGIFSERKPLACIQLTQVEPKTYEFGMLSTDSSARNQKLASQLVHFVEARAKAQGANKMQLHLLQGKNEKDNSKSEIEKWYLRMGYVHVGNKEVHDVSEDLSKELNQPAHFLFFEKDLS